MLGISTSALFGFHTKKPFVSVLVCERKREIVWNCYSVCVVFKSLILSNHSIIDSKMLLSLTLNNVETHVMVLP